MSASFDPSDRESCIIGVAVNLCSPDDAGNSVLNELSLAIPEIQDASLNLVRSSRTTWKFNDIVAIPSSVNQLSVTILSAEANIGQIVFEKQDWDVVVDDGGHSEICLKRDINTKDEIPKLSISLEVCTDIMAEIALDDLIIAASIFEDSNMLHAVMSRLENDDPMKADGLHDCGDRFYKTFNVSRNKDDISKAIAIYEEATECLSEGDARRWEFISDIGLAYMLRYEVYGEVKDLEEAISKLTTATEKTEEGDADLPIRLNNLGMAISHRFKRTGQLVDISEAIQNMQRAVQINPEGHPAFLNNLGQALVFRFEHNGDRKDFSEAVGHLKRAIDLTPKGDPDIPTWLNNLGNAFSALFEHTGDLYDISQAIQYMQRAVHLAPDGHTDLPAIFNNLGNSFSRRYKRFRELSDISEAVDNLQRAVRLTPRGRAILPLMLNNLGNTLLHRFEKTGELQDISEAIDNMQLGVLLSPKGHADLPRQLNNLGISFSRQFTHTGDINHISEAIRNQQLAVKSTPNDHADLPARLCNLGYSFLRRFERTGVASDLSEATRNLEHAIQLTPEGHADLPRMFFHLGNSALFRFEQTDDLAFITAAASNYRLSATSSTGSLALRLEAAKLWTTFSMQPLFPSSELLEAHECVIRLLSLITGLENTVQRRHETLVEYSQLSVAASAAALSAGRPDKAIEWLAEGRCIVWNQLNQLRTPVDKLRAYDADLADRLSSLSIALENAGSRMDPRSVGTELSMKAKISLQEEANGHLKLAKEWEELLSTIRSIKGLEDFLQPRTCTDIMSGLPNDGPVIIINVHEDRCDALALMAGSDDPIHIPLPNFSLQQATHSVVDLRSYLSRHGIRSRLGRPLEDNPPLPDETFLRVLKMLWSDIVGPIMGALAFSVSEPDEKMPRIWWCPTGPLVFLPIHAAGIYDGDRSTPGQCLTDFAISSYIPTLHSLTDKPDTQKDVTNTVSGLLMVSQANTPGFSDLPFVKEEVEKVKAQLVMRGIKSTMLPDQYGTVDQVLQSIESFSCIHLACHAFQDTTSPLKSAICLHDGRLELSEIIKKNNPHADFAFMSACQTSKGDEKLTEEVVHLAAGMLAAGYRSVVGTMWSIFDKHGPDVAELFYTSLLDYTKEVRGEPKIDGRDAARSLHHALKCHREKLVSDFPDSLLAWVPYIHVGI